MLQRVMLSEDDYSESEISEFYVFDEANDMEEEYRSVHDDDSGDDSARSERSEEDGKDGSNEQGTNYSITVNAVDVAVPEAFGEVHNQADLKIMLFDH